MLILKNSKLQNYDNDLFLKDNKVSFKNGEEINVPSNVKYIVPGFIDQHIHGVKNCDVMDNSYDSIITMKKALVNEGTTAFLPTTLTYDIDVLKSTVEHIEKAKENNVGAIVLGSHIEGPFINKIYKGAQNEKYIIKPNIKDFEYINSAKNAKVVTYAPELDENFEFTKYMYDNNIIGSIGHTNATCEEANNAIKNGARSFTHFHNASTPHHHREPGVVSSGLMNKNVNVELIVDGIHLHPNTVKTVYNIKGYENITLITDSMRAKQMPDGEYDLGGQAVIKKGSEARLKDGTLAGSILKMNDAVKNMIEFSGCSEEEAFKMASENPAKLLKVDKGIIKENSDFDITMLDENFNVIEVYVNGIKQELEIK